MDIAESCESNDDDCFTEEDELPEDQRNSVEAIGCNSDEISVRYSSTPVPICSQICDNGNDESRDHQDVFRRNEIKSSKRRVETPLPILNQLHDHEQSVDGDGMSGRRPGTPIPAVCKLGDRNEYENQYRDENVRCHHNADEKLKITNKDDESFGQFTKTLPQIFENKYKKKSSFDHDETYTRFLNHLCDMNNSLSWFREGEEIYKQRIKTDNDNIYQVRNASDMRSAYRYLAHRFVEVQQHGLDQEHGSKHGLKLLRRLRKHGRFRDVVQEKQLSGVFNTMSEMVYTTEEFYAEETIFRSQIKHDSFHLRRVKDVRELRECYFLLLRRFVAVQYYSTQQDCRLQRCLEILGLSWDDHNDAEKELSDTYEQKPNTEEYGTENLIRPNFDRKRSKRPHFSTRQSKHVNGQCTPSPPPTPPTSKQRPPVKKAIVPPDEPTEKGLPPVPRHIIDPSRIAEPSTVKIFREKLPKYKAASSGYGTMARHLTLKKDIKRSVPTLPPLTQYKAVKSSGYGKSASQSAPKQITKPSIPTLRPLAPRKEVKSSGYGRSAKHPASKQVIEKSIPKLPRLALRKRSNLESDPIRYASKLLEEKKDSVKGLVKSHLLRKDLMKMVDPNVRPRGSKPSPKNEGFDCMNGRKMRFSDAVVPSATSEHESKTEGHRVIFPEMVKPSTRSEHKSNSTGIKTFTFSRTLKQTQSCGSKIPVRLPSKIPQLPKISPLSNGLQHLEPSKAQQAKPTSSSLLKVPQLLEISSSSNSCLQDLPQPPKDLRAKPTSPSSSKIQQLPELSRPSGSRHSLQPIKDPRVKSASPSSSKVPEFPHISSASNSDLHHRPQPSKEGAKSTSPSTIPQLPEISSNSGIQHLSQPPKVRRVKSTPPSSSKIPQSPEIAAASYSGLQNLQTSKFTPPRSSKILKLPEVSSNSGSQHLLQLSKVTGAKPIYPLLSKIPKLPKRSSRSNSSFQHFSLLSKDLRVISTSPSSPKVPQLPHYSSASNSGLHYLIQPSKEGAKSTSPSEIPQLPEIFSNSGLQHLPQPPKVRRVKSTPPSSSKIPQLPEILSASNNGLRHLQPSIVERVISTSTSSSKVPQLPEIASASYSGLQNLQTSKFTSPRSSKILKLPEVSSNSGSQHLLQLSKVTGEKPTYPILSKVPKLPTLSSRSNSSFQHFSLPSKDLRVKSTSPRPSKIPQLPDISTHSKSRLQHPPRPPPQFSQTPQSKFTSPRRHFPRI